MTLEEAHLAAHTSEGDGSGCPLVTDELLSRYGFDPAQCRVLKLVRIGWVSAVETLAQEYEDRKLLADPELRESLGQLRQGEGVVVRLARTVADEETTEGA